MTPEHRLLMEARTRALYKLVEKHRSEFEKMVEQQKVLIEAERRRDEREAIAS